MEKPSQARGKLRIGDDWNAITIIALSQSSPLKAIAELVENSIDAKARTVTITRGREHGRHYLAIRDDGEGVPRDADGRPDFRYVATHICDSVKRRLKAEGSSGLQGEFGIGLLSFWTVGEELTMTSTGADQRAYQMVMRKGDPSYTVTPNVRCSSTAGRSCGSRLCSTESDRCRGRRSSGISRPSCATGSGRPACVSMSSTGSRASNMPSSRANTRGGFCISCRRCARRSAISTSSSI